jgi:hypothetical protein
MKKKATKGKDQPKGASPGSRSTSIRRADITSLVAEVRSLVHSARQTAATAVNTLQVLTNFEIGRRIVEHEQQGAKRASYVTELLSVLSADLTQEFGTGFSATNLRLMRQFFVEYSGRIHQTLSDESLPRLPIRQTASDESANPFVVGLVLDKQKKTAVVELTLPKESNIHARQYQLYLPSKELLQQKLLEWTREAKEHS